MTSRERAREYLTEELDFPGETFIFEGEEMDTAVAKLASMLDAHAAEAVHRDRLRSDAEHLTAIRADEREACARVVEAHFAPQALYPSERRVVGDIAAAIRARGEK